jgi:hypothetical protein
MRPRPAYSSCRVHRILRLQTAGESVGSYFAEITVSWAVAAGPLLMHRQLRFPLVPPAKAGAPSGAH